MNRWLKNTTLLWQLPLTLLSFLFYRINRLLLHALESRKNKQSNAIGRDYARWLGLSAILQQPLMLPYIMVTGPRWNCHAMIVFLSEIYITHCVSIDFSIANQSAANWTCIIYNKDYSVAYGFSSHDNKEQIELSLPSGDYRINFRYYRCKKNILMPAVVADNKKVVDIFDMTGELSDYENYLYSIRNKFSSYYLFLHYYMYYLLRWKKYFPDRFIRKEFLPVGNPKTHFNYGCAEKGQRIYLKVFNQLLEGNDIYITYYNRCSFPVFWHQITKNDYQSTLLDCSGYYLIRINNKNNVKKSFPYDDLDCYVK